MNWDERCDEETVRHYSDWVPREVKAQNRRAARWQREQFRSDEAVERVAYRMFRVDCEHWPQSTEWADVTEPIKDQYRADARAAIAALLGEEA